jgi:hypothetical protein
MIAIKGQTTMEEQSQVKDLKEETNNMLINSQLIK